MNPIPFTVIGGYLGAGKTTLLNHLLANTRGLRIAALVNDFGSVNIDAELIRDHDGETMNLANGCLCCSLVNGFAVAIRSIGSQSERFDRIVIEASGVAYPEKIAQYGQMYRLPLDGIVVLADAEQVRTQAENKYVGDTVVRQFAQADLIVLNRTDLVSAGAAADLRSWLRALAPCTPIVEAVHSNVPLDVLLGWHDERTLSTDAAYRRPTRDDHHLDAFETWTIERTTPCSRDDLKRFAATLGPHIYRAKGFVHLGEDPLRSYLYQQVGQRLSLAPDTPWKPDSRRTRLVVIGRRGATDVLSLHSRLAETIEARGLGTGGPRPRREQPNQRHRGFARQRQPRRSR